MPMKRLSTSRESRFVRRRESGPRTHRRHLRLESLERRDLLAGDVLLYESFDDWSDVPVDWNLQLAPGGTIEASSQGEPFAGSAHLYFNPAPASNASLAAGFQIDLAAEQSSDDVWLDFWAKREGFSWTGETYVEISDDAVQWTTIATFDPPTTYQRYLIDLDDSAPPLDAETHVRFRHLTSSTCCPQQLWLDEVRVVTGDYAGPQVTAYSPAMLPADAAMPNRITVTFNEPIDVNSFTAEDVDLRNPQGQPIAVDPPRPIDGTANTQFEITFPGQNVRGVYDLKIGPNVTDVAGIPLNQDGDFSPGTSADRFFGTLTFDSSVATAGEQPDIFQEEFDDWSEPPTYWSFVSIGEGTVATTGAGGPLDGGQHLHFDPGPDNATSQSATLKLDLSDHAGEHEIWLDFWARSQGAISTGEFYVEISNDGQTWTSIIGFDPPATYGRYVFPLAFETAPLSADTQIRFRHHTTTTCCPHDIYLDRVRITSGDIVGPTVVAFSPVGAVAGPLDSVTVTFDQPINAETFTTDDVIVLDGLKNAVPLAGDPVDSGDQRTWTIHFANPVELGGTYRVVIGPDVHDLSGNAMNQDGDHALGETNGDDSFGAEFVLLQVPTTEFPYFQGLDDETALGPHWSFRSDDGGNIRFVEDNGRHVIRMDNPGGWSTNEAILAIDLTGQSGVKLVFDDFNLFDELHDADEVAISDDGGTTWYRIDDLTLQGNQWNRHEIDLDAAIADAGMNYGPEFLIAFRQYDNWRWGSDGRQFDNVRVTNDTQAPRVLSSSAVGSIASGTEFNQVTFTFSEPIDPATFGLDDVRFVGPSGDLSSALLGIVGSGTTFTVNFENQTDFGRYELSIGPHIRDFGANPMDQNENGLVAEPADDRFSVVVDIVRPVTLPFSEDFSNGMPGPEWVFYSTGNGRTLVANGGLRMDSATGYALNEAILHLNLLNATRVTLDFDHYNPADEPDHDGLVVGDTYTEPHRNADLVSISDNGGASWYVIQTLDEAGHFSFDLDEITAAAGLSYSENFLIKFQQYDNAPYSGDGRIFDNISVGSGLLTLTVDRPTISEGDGSAAATATVTREDGSIEGDLIVHLTSSDTSELRIPATVVIPSGETSATFPLDAVDDTLVDGLKTVTISARAAGFVAGEVNVDVLDDEPATLVVNVPSLAYTESTGTVKATVTRNRDFTGAMLVELAVSDVSEVRAPATVTIPSGEPSVEFTLQIVNDAELDGDQNVLISATAQNWVTGSDSFQVTDDDTADLRTIGGPIGTLEGVLLPSTTYIVTGDLIVEADKSLTIEAPAVLRFVKGAQLIVRGTLTADADSGSEIFFTSDHPTPRAGDWRGILFENAGQPRSVLNHVDIAFATDGVRVHPNSSNPLVSIQNSAIHGGSGDGVSVSTGSAVTIAADDVVIQNNHIFDNDDYGILLSSFHTGCNNTHNAPTIAGNEISHNGLGGVYAESNANSVLPCIPVRSGGVFAVLDGNYIHHNPDGVVATSARFKENQNDTIIAMHVVNNLIVQNSGDGVRLQAASSFASLSPRVVNNTIADNGGAGIRHSAETDDGFYVGNNIIAFNDIGIAAAATFEVPDDDVRFNIVAGNAASNWLNYPASFGTATTINSNGTPADDAMNLDADPEFVGGGDYRLTGTSPAIDAGNSFLAPTDDFDGNQRFHEPDIGFDEFLALVLSFSRTQFSEADGANASTVTVTRMGADTTDPLIVYLDNGDASELTIPSSVTIPAGEASVEFSLAAVDDTLLDGPQIVMVTATAEGLADAQVALTVLDHESLTLEIRADWVYEIAGDAASTATVTRHNSDIDEPLVVNLTNGDLSEIEIPASVTIPAGQTSVNFAIRALDDGLMDGPKLVPITAWSTGYESAIDSLEVRNVTSWQNPLNAMDVTANGEVAAADVLAIINYINEYGVGDLPMPLAGSEMPAPFLDVSGDHRVTTIDALLVINYLNIPTVAEGETETTFPLLSIDAFPRFAQRDPSDSTTPTDDHDRSKSTLCVPRQIVDHPSPYRLSKKSNPIGSGRLEQAELDEFPRTLEQDDLLEEAIAAFADEITRQWQRPTPGR